MMFALNSVILSLSKDQFSLLVPKLAAVRRSLGTSLSAQFHCSALGSAMELPQQARPQMEFGNEENWHLQIQGNPKGVAVIQPRVGVQRLPWVWSSRTPTLKGLKRIGHRATCNSTLSGLDALSFTQGRRCCANPGLYDCNPFRIAGAGNRRGSAELTYL